MGDDLAPDRFDDVVLGQLLMLDLGVGLQFLGDVVAAGAGKDMQQRQLGAVVLGQVAGDVDRAGRVLRAVDGNQDMLEHGTCLRVGSSVCRPAGRKVCSWPL